MLALNSRVPDEIQKRIRNCQTEDDWDDNGAIGITSRACEVAIRFIALLLERSPGVEMPKVSPSLLGTVTLYWQDGPKHLMVCPAPDTGLAYYQYERLGHETVYGDETQEQAIQRVLDFLCSQNAESY